MNLFKRIFLSLFPDEVINQQINPAAIFVSFIIAKNFFSIINRKIVENYKLNLFDISLDSFEVKIGFGDITTLKIKDFDFYFSYAIVSNFNGFRFFSPANIGNNITLISSYYAYRHFEANQADYFLNFLLTIYLLTFIFIARFRVFPDLSDKINYNWFIELFFEFYRVILNQTNQKISAKAFHEIKKKLLQEIQVFFMLYYFYKKLNNIFAYEKLEYNDIFYWLFYDEIKGGAFKTVLQKFLNNTDKYIYKNTFEEFEKKILNLIFPADLLFKYLFNKKDCFLLAQNLVDKIMDKKIIDNYLASFLKNDNLLFEFLIYVSDYNLLKQNFFEGIKKFNIQKFKNYEMSGEEEDKVDEFMSSIGNIENLKNVKIPNRIKEEFEVMERLINFYISYVGGFWIARGDNYYLRLFKKDLLIDLMKISDKIKLSQENLYYYGALLYLYSKNVFFYKYALDNVREGKDTINFPFRSDFKEIYSNNFIITQFEVNFICNLLQDINIKDIKIYLLNKDIIDEFKFTFQKKISTRINLPNNELIEATYGQIKYFLKKGSYFVDVLNIYLTGSDISNLKENIYTFDFVLWIDFLTILKQSKINLKHVYTDITIIGIFSVLRDTLFGIIFFLICLEKEYKKNKLENKTKHLITIYIQDTLSLSHEYNSIFTELILVLKDKYEYIFNKWLKIDDNKKYLEIGIDNWISYTEKRDEEKIMLDIAGEDLIWFRGFLKNITYYNKRYIIPKD